MYYNAKYRIYQKQVNDDIDLERVFIYTNNDDDDIDFFKVKFEITTFNQQTTFLSSLCYLLDLNYNDMICDFFLKEEWNRCITISTLKHINRKQFYSNLLKEIHYVCKKENYDIEFNELVQSIKNVDQLIKTIEKKLLTIYKYNIQHLYKKILDEYYIKFKNNLYSDTITDEDLNFIAEIFNVNIFIYTSSSFEDDDESKIIKKSNYDVEYPSCILYQHDTQYFPIIIVIHDIETKTIMNIYNLIN